MCFCVVHPLNEIVEWISCFSIKYVRTALIYSKILICINYTAQIVYNLFRITHKEYIFVFIKQLLCRYLNGSDNKQTKWKINKTVKSAPFNQSIISSKAILFLIRLIYGLIIKRLITHIATYLSVYDIWFRIVYF